MSKTVSRDKYESMKEKAQKWLDKASDYETRLDDIIDEKDILELENSQLQDEVEFLTERCKNMSMQIKRGHHGIFAQRHMSANKIVFAEYTPHANFVELIHQFAFEYIVIANNKTFVSVKTSDAVNYCRSAHCNVAKMVYFIAWFDILIPVCGHTLVHGLNVVKLANVFAVCVFEVKKIGVAKSVCH